MQKADQIVTNESGIPKSREKFYQREQKFKKLFDAKLEQWRKEAGPIPEEDVDGHKVKSSANRAVQLYKERGQTYRIIGNKIMARALEPDRRYVNPQVKILNDKAFDPIRIKLRIMPISRAPLVQGKTPDYYFIEAAKKSLSGDLTHAIELLKRGLLIKPNHFLCRFNHGVLMFKMGLIKEARSDFEMLIHPGLKEPWVYFNLATCLIQLGRPMAPAPPNYHLHEKNSSLRKKLRTATRQLV